MKIRALVVDDSRSMRRIVMKGLRHAQLAEFDFQEAVDGDDALEKFNPEEYDIVFIDWNMPKMNGIDVVRKIREDSLNDQVKLVMVTSNKTMDFVTEALDDAGANGFISKPFTPKDMRNKLEQIIGEIIQIKKAQGGLLGKLFGR
jgi:two-component system chemotaxis response regulator CheY